VDDLRLGVLKRYFNDENLCSQIIKLEDENGSINIRDILLGMGLSEVYISSFISSKPEYVAVDGFLLPGFVARYKADVSELEGKKNAYKEMKKNIMLVDSVPVDTTFDYHNTA
jgi:hypothetical protein